MDAGGLVPDVVTIGIVREGLSKPECANGFILDGFPRTEEQAVALDGILKDLGIKLTGVVNISVPDSELVARVVGRRICKACGATYHVSFNPSKVENVCDKCGGNLYQRNDDKEETVVNRLHAYHEQTEPLIEYYKNKACTKKSMACSLSIKYMPTLKLVSDVANKEVQQCPNRMLLRLKVQS